MIYIFPRRKSATCMFSMALLFFLRRTVGPRAGYRWSHWPVVTWRDSLRVSLFTFFFCWVLTGAKKSHSFAGKKCNSRVRQNWRFDLCIVRTCREGLSFPSKKKLQGRRFGGTHCILWDAVFGCRMSSPLLRAFFVLFKKWKFINWNIKLLRENCCSLLLLTAWALNLHSRMSRYSLLNERIKCKFIKNISLSE